MAAGSQTPTWATPAGGIPHLGPGAGLARLHQFAEAMGDGPERDTSEHWRIFTEEFFASTGSMHLVLWNPSSRERKAFELPIAVVPRWFYTNYTSGVRSMSFYFENPREYMAGSGYPPIPRIYKMDLNLPSERVTHFVECKRAMLVLRFETGWQVQMTGLLRAAFVPQVRPAPSGSGQTPSSSTMPAQVQLKLEGLDYIVNHHASFLTRQAITSVATEERIPLQVTRQIAAEHKGANGSVKNDMADDSSKSTSSGGSDSNELSDYKISIDKPVVPECPVNEYGITLRVMRCLEITESVCQLRDLMDFTLRDENNVLKSLSNGDDAATANISPIDGMRRLAAQYREAARQKPETIASAQAGSESARSNGIPGTPVSTFNGGTGNGGTASATKRKNTINQSPATTPRIGSGASPSPHLGGSPKKRMR